jgi:NADPH-dependent 2,4-dienoyl-CoA reductase/sulfur reductase-like enzyme
VKTYQYLIVGGGMTADAAIEGIREIDPEGSIALISAEKVPPYDRPPLSKDLWKDGEVEEIWRHTDDKAVDLYLSHRVKSIDPQKKTVMDDHGQEYEYGKLLLATGGRPRELPFANGAILYYRTYADYEKLRHEVEAEGDRFAVIGGGFIGSELAAALTLNGQQVTMVFTGDAMCSSIFPPGLAQHVTQYYEDKGVRILSGQTVSDVKENDGVFKVSTGKGESFEVDHVVAGVGIQPNTELAEAIGLAVDDGIRVAEDLQTDEADIYAAGDVASFPSHIGYGRRRVEHEDNALTMGRVAGHNMAGKSEPYTHISMFYSDLFDLGYEAVGRIDSSLDMVEDWQADDYEKGVVYYLDGGQVKGVLLWNVWDKVDDARALLRDLHPKLEKDLIGRL